MSPAPSMAVRAIRNSLVFKIFAVCFLAIHLPLLAMIGYLARGYAVEPLPVLGLLLCATSVGTVACLGALWWFIKPLRSLAGAIARYNVDGTPVRLHIERRDEIGVVAHAVTHTITELDQLMKKLRHQASTDPLTGLGNRRWLGERIAVEQARAEREGLPVSMVLFDLDHFKDINDQHGHEIGDHVLMAVGEVVHDNLRRYDMAARIGGEEFCLVLPRTRVGEAMMIAERLRKRLEKTVISPLKSGRVTASFGVYEAHPRDSMQHMLMQSDQALYQSKASGRNRVTESESHRVRG